MPHLPCVECVLKDRFSMDKPCKKLLRSVKVCEPCHANGLSCHPVPDEFKSFAPQVNELLDKYQRMDNAKLKQRWSRECYEVLENLKGFLNGYIEKNPEFMAEKNVDTTTARKRQTIDEIDMSYGAADVLKVLEGMQKQLDNFQRLQNETVERVRGMDELLHRWERKAQAHEEASMQLQTGDNQHEAGQREDGAEKVEKM